MRLIAGLSLVASASVRAGVPRPIASRCKAGRFAGACRFHDDRCVLPQARRRARGQRSEEDGNTTLSFNRRRMYCAQSTTIGTNIMGKNVTAGADPFKLSVVADGDEATVTFSGDDLTGYGARRRPSSNRFALQSQSLRRIHLRDGVGRLRGRRLQGQALDAQRRQDRRLQERQRRHGRLRQVRRRAALPLPDIQPERVGLGARNGSRRSAVAVARGADSERAPTRNARRLGTRAATERAASRRRRRKQTPERRPHTRCRWPMSSQASGVLDSIEQPTFDASGARHVLRRTQRS